MVIPSSLPCPQINNPIFPPIFLFSYLTFQRGPVMSGKMFLTSSSPLITWPVCTQNLRSFSFSKKNLILPTASKYCWGFGGTDYGARLLLVFRSCLSFLICSRGIVRCSDCENVMGLSHFKQCAQHHSWQTVIMNYIDSRFLGPGSHLSYL